MLQHNRNVRAQLTAEEPKSRLRGSTLGIPGPKTEPPLPLSPAPVPHLLQPVRVLTDISAQRERVNSFRAVARLDYGRAAPCSIRVPSMAR